MKTQEKPVILVTDDEAPERYALRRALEKEGYTLLEAENGRQALDIVRSRRPDLVLCDINMPVMDGLEALDEIKKLDDPPLVIMLTAFGSERVAVAAMKRGAYDYLAKPFEVDELRLIIRNALEKIQLRRENIRLKQQVASLRHYGEILAQSDPMKRVFEIIERVAPTDATVLIQGESGTGKELVAREIHRRSQRRDASFVCVNSAAMPENLIESELFGHEKGAFTGALNLRRGKFELADGGTIFFDEIGDMSPNMQAKILRVLEGKSFQRLGSNETKHVDCRIISASNKDLVHETVNGRFREDLFYRLKVVDVFLPPLRERPGDIPLLAGHFVKIACGKYGRPPLKIDEDTMRVLVRHPWPGNVRQMENLIEKTVIMTVGESLAAADVERELAASPATGTFPGASAAAAPGEKRPYQEIKKQAVGEFERKFLAAKLREHGGNISQTAKSLGLHRQSLQHKLKELGINAPANE